jgi:hypothetical protein
MADPGDYGLDFAWSKPSIAAIEGGGYTFVLRYLSWSSSGSKVLSKTEKDSYLAAGLAVGLNWEHSDGDQRGGASEGAFEGAEAYRQARALGAPQGDVIYFSCDFDVQPGEMATVEAYWTAARKALQGYYRFGVYGGLRAVSRALALGYHGWQTYAWSTRDGAIVWAAGAHIRQIRNGISVGGADCDRNQLMKADAGLIEGDDMSAAEVWGWDVDPGTGTYSAGGAVFVGMNRAGTIANVQLPQVIATLSRMESAEKLQTAAIEAMSSLLANAGGDVDATPILAAIAQVKEELGASLAEAVAKVSELDAELDAERTQSAVLRQQLAAAYAAPTQA